MKNNKLYIIGRFWKFYQCDFDIAASGYGLMISESEVLKIVVEILI